MERRLSVLGRTSNEMEDIQAQVSRMLTRVKVVGSYTVLTTLEQLVEVAQRHGHKDATYWRKALEECRSHEGSDGFADLVKSLFGSAEDKKVSAAVQGWMKGRMLEQPGPQRQTQASSQEVVALPPPPPPPPPHYPYYPPPYYPYPQSPYRHSSRGRARAANRSAGRQQSEEQLCFVCSEPGHRALQCPKRQATGKK